jgi:hypothetical protein
MDFFDHQERARSNTKRLDANSIRNTTSNTPDHERFAESLMCVSKDPGLEHHLVFVVVRTRRSYIAQLALDKLGLSEARQAQIERALRRDPSVRPPHASVAWDRLLHDGLTPLP